MEIVVRNGEIPYEERRYYAQYIMKKYPSILPERITLTLDGDWVEITVEPSRHTVTKMGGTLIGDPLRWNDAKRAEYFDTIPNPIEL